MPGPPEFHTERQAFVDKAMQGGYGAKALAIMDALRDADRDGRKAKWLAVNQQFSPKSVKIKFGELVERGYIVPVDGKPEQSTLTEKGRRALEQSRSSK